MNLFTLYADLALDASGFESGVKKASRQGNTLASSLRGGLGSASQTVINNMSAASVAVGNLLADVARATANTGKQLVQTGINYNSTMENYQTNFATMLGGSSEAAQALTADLQEMAASTPFAMTDLADASQTLLAFGQDSSTVMETLQSLGDIAMGDKNKLSSLTLAFSQASSAGKLMGQDLMQMINAGFNPLTTIAEKTGASIGDLKEFMSSGKASKELQKQMNAARREVRKLGDDASDGAKMLVQMYEDGAISAELLGQIFDIETSPGGRFYKAMENASKTISGLSATLEDDFTALTGKVLMPVTDWLRDKLLPGAIAAVKRLDAAFDVGGLSGLASEATKIVTETFSEWGALAFDAGSGLLASVLSGLTGDTVTKEAVQNTLSDIWTAVENGVNDIINTVQRLDEAFDVGGLSGLASETTKIFSETFAEWGTLAFDAGADLLSSVLSGLTGDTVTKDEVQRTLSGIWTAGTNGVNDIITVAKTLWRDIDAALGEDTTVGEKIAGVFDAFADAKTGVLTSAGTLFADLYGNITGDTENAENIKDSISGILSSWGEATSSVFASAGTLFDDIAQNLGEDTTVGEKIAGVFSAFNEAHMGVLTAAGTLFADIYGKLTGDTDNAEKIESSISGLLSSFDGAVDSVLAAAGGLFDSIYEALTGQEATAENVNKTIAGIFNAGIGAASDLLGVADTFFADVAVALGEDTSVGEKIAGIFEAGGYAMNGLVYSAGTLVSRMYAAIFGDAEGAAKIQQFFSDLFNPENFVQGDLSGKTSSESVDEKRVEARNIVSSLYAGGKLSESQLDDYFTILAGPVNDVFRETLEEIFNLEERGQQREESHASQWDPADDPKDGEGMADIVAAALDAVDATMQALPGMVAASLAGIGIDLDGVTVGNLVLPTVSAGIARNGRLMRKTGFEKGG